MTKIVYYEQDDILFIEISQGSILRDESVTWNITIGYTADGIGEITILDAQKERNLPAADRAGGYRCSLTAHPAVRDWFPRRSVGARMER